MSLPFFQGEFHCVSAEFTGDTLALNWRIDGAEFSQSFTERVRYKGAPALSELAPHRLSALQRAANVLLLMAGTSYYKALVPKTIVANHVDADLAALAGDVYRLGLGEFAYQNRIQLDPRFAITATAADADTLMLESRALVAMGGGKDSLVSVEALKAAGIAACAVWIGQSELIEATGKAAGLPLLNIERKVDPALFALNQQGALNGHVPVTAINSAILAVAALWYGYDQIVFSNEASANSATLNTDGVDVNHQWSKSFAFEQKFASYLREHVARDLRYYSLLRGYRELAIAKAFAVETRYDAVFSSCNRNFKILGAKPTQRWCGVCPKCHFVFLALAPFLAKPRLLSIFGRNLLDDSEQAAGFDALMELDGAHKPFECVGEAQESRAAMLHLATRADWQEDALVQRFVAHHAKHLQNTATLAELAKELPDPTLVPTELAAILRSRVFA